MDGNGMDTNNNRQTRRHILVVKYHDTDVPNGNRKECLTPSTSVYIINFFCI